MYSDKQYHNINTLLPSDPRDPLSFFDTGDNSIRDIAWDGSHIWAINLSGVIYKFSLSGERLATYSGLLSAGWGLTYDGVYLWASNPDTDKLYQLSFPGLGDFTPPAAPELASGTHPAEDLWYADPSPTFNWTDPSDPTGISGYSFWLDHTPETVPDTLSEGITNSVTFVDLADGTWYFHCRAKDGAGNWGAANHYRIRIDTVAPQPPVNPEAVPANWTNINLFQATWTYPPDSSLVAGTFYKLGAPPDHDTDGIFIQATQVILSVPAQGEYSLYLWLEDGAGNRDHLAAGMVSLRYDITGPVNGQMFINGDADVTGSLNVTLTDLNAVDALSGMGPGAQMRFSNGTGWSPAENYQPVRTGWNLVTYGGSGDPGEKTVFVQYRDAAGNWSENFTDTIVLAEPLAIVTETLPGGAAGFAYEETLAVTGGVPPFAWSLSTGTLPPDMILESAGIIRGPLEETGTWDFEVKVSDLYSSTRFRTFRITIYAGTIRGDVNGNSKPDMMDLFLAVGHILGTQELTYPQIWAADASPDGEVNIADLVAIANLIMGWHPGTPKISGSSVTLAMTQETHESEDARDLFICLENDIPVSGLQIRLGLPTGTNLRWPPQLTDRGRTLTLACAEQNGETILILYPGESRIIAPGEGPVAHLVISGGGSPDQLGEMMVHQALATDIDGRLVQVHLKSGSGLSAQIPTFRAFNYPNPFNPDTRITFSLQQGGVTRITVYDLLGRVVRTISDGHFDEGMHTVEWNGRDEGSLPVPSGVYYCRIENHNMSQTIPLTLIK